VSDRRLTLLSTVAIACIDLYRSLRHETGVCRYSPSCSEYARGAVLKYGAWRGSILALRRLARCRPPHGGDDPVP
jgi:hypothetical protein